MYLLLSLGLAACGVKIDEQTPGVGGGDAGPDVDGPPSTPIDGRIDAPPAPLPTGPFTNPTKVIGLSADNRAEDDVTMNDAETEMVFAILANNNKELYTTKRANAQAAWDPPALIQALSATGTDSAARLSKDGLSLYYGGVRGGNSEDVWVSTRVSLTSPWQTPTRMPVINDNNRADRWYNPCGNRYVMVSDRTNSGDFDLYEGVQGAAPTRLAISTNGSSDISPFLTDDCLIMYWSHDDDLFMATRASIDSPWEAKGPVTELNKAGSAQQDPWMSKDRKRMYYASSEDGESDIYMATRDR